MATMNLSSRGRRSRISAVISVLFGAAPVALTAVAREIRLRRAEHILEAMPDRMLKDMGLSRCDIPHRVRRLPD